MRIGLLCFASCLILGSSACGKTANEAPKAASGGSDLAAGGEFAATGGAIAPLGGAGPQGGSLTSGGGSGGSGGNAPTAGDGALGLCPGHDSFIALMGDLPDVGSDVTFRAGCPDSLLGAYPKAASFTGGPGESTGTWVSVLGCSADGSRELLLGFHFAWNRSDASVTSELVGATLQYRVNRSSRALSLTNVVETQKPVDAWPALSGETEGVGKIYESSFSADGSPAGTPVHVTGRFSVCHVANLPQG